MDVWASIGRSAVDILKDATGVTKSDTVEAQATVKMLDLILSEQWATYAMDSVMLSTSTVAAKSSTLGGPIINTQLNVKALYDVITSRGNWTIASNIDKFLAEALSIPNISGIPISTQHYSESREVDVSESMVLVQSTSTKKYWTDNAVPRLKTWNMDGYITSLSAADAGLRIKPSLTWQARYLDICAKSRRPIMFKTSRGEFTKVQITSLNLEEDPSYNNAIHISISLKEYAPYYVEELPSTIHRAQLIGAS